MEFATVLTQLEQFKRTGEICGIKIFEKNVKEKDIFVCIKGINQDGHNYAKAAIEKGAVFIIAEKDLGLGENQILVKNTKQAYALLCAQWFKNPAKSLKLIAVTGTNGKTTVTNLIKRMLENLTKKPVGLIGTIYNEIGSIKIPAKYTTPEPFELNSILATMKNFGCEYVVIEASSHALEQQRLFGMTFEVGAFTNLTQDHLDFHKTMEKYFEAKKRLFTMSEQAIVNIDDPFGVRIYTEEKLKKQKIFSVSCKKVEADIFVKDIELFETKSEFKIIFNNASHLCCFNMPGEFSVYNAAVAWGTTVKLGFEPKQVTEALKICKNIAGRSEIIYKDSNIVVMRDYAHSPDSLKNILKTIKAFKKGRLVLLFGCAGERDRTKRAEMGRIAAELADFVVLTSDNPREEPEEQILLDAEKGLKLCNTPCRVFCDRMEAINWVLQNRKQKDIILLAGKGHENYQVLRECTVLFDEREIVLDFFNERI